MSADGARGPHGHVAATCGSHDPALGRYSRPDRVIGMNEGARRNDWPRAGGSQATSNERVSYHYLRAISSKAAYLYRNVHLNVNARLLRSGFLMASPA